MIAVTTSEVRSLFDIVAGDLYAAPAPRQRETHHVLRGVGPVVHSRLAFGIALHGQGDAEPTQRFVITLAYTYRPPVFTRESEAIANPFGFKVTAYSRDPEYTPPASTAAAGGTP